ncbi:uncharacterized protein LOC136085442 [Hydra vulgaris]|uniref:Uncharacterized protein LOC136085442 n=1 Tax=Hydra vulgaris TaxID=6087 RepID=A0ABM4CLZ2_HYDVU
MPNKKSYENSPIKVCGKKTFTWVKKSSDASKKPFCRLCRTNLRPHKGSLEQHQKAASHIKSEKTLNPFQKKINFTGEVKISDVNKKADIQLLMCICCHSAISTTDHLCEIISKFVELSQKRRHEFKEDDDGSIDELFDAIGLEKLNIATHFRLSSWDKNKPGTLVIEQVNSSETKINKTLKKKVNQRIKKFEYDLALNSKSIPKKVYAYINNKTKVKENIRAIQLKNGSIVTGLKVIANTLNGYFASVFIKPQASFVPIIDIETQTFCRSPDFNISVVEKYLSKLDTNKATGMDKVHLKVLKECNSAFAKPLSLILNKSFETSKLPKLWSCANIIPLFKNGNKLDPSNYKSVSLTSVVCKVMERIIKHKMMKYLVDNKLINKNQHGFVNNKSCVTNLLESLDFITNSIDNGWDVIVLFLDFAKTFDSVDRERLFLKLNAFGDNTSGWEEVVSGVPQGSVLGPLLFVAYINDISNKIKPGCKLFADDTKILRAIKNDNDIIELQQDTDVLMEWPNEWLMKFNQQKCKIMVSDDIGWKHHVKKVVNKANQKLSQIKHTFKLLDEKTTKLLFIALVRPHLEYAAPIWNPYWQYDKDKLESCQQRATKIESLRGYSYEERLKKLGLLSLENRRRRGEINGVEMGRILHSTNACINIVNHIGNEMRINIIAEVIKSKSKILIIIDESTTINQKSTLIVYIRCCVKGSGMNSPINLFLDLVELESVTAKGLFVALIECLHSYGMKDEYLENYLFSVACDGAAVMLGCKSGVFKLITNKFPFVIVWHCANHRLELSVGDTIRDISCQGKLLCVHFDTKLVKEYFYGENRNVERLVLMISSSSIDKVQLIGVLSKTDSHGILQRRK